MAYQRQKYLAQGEDNNTVPPAHSLREVVAMPWHKQYEAARVSFGSQRYSGRSHHLQARIQHKAHGQHAS